MIGLAKLEVTWGNHIITLDVIKLITSAKPIYNCKLKNHSKKKRASKSYVPPVK